MTGETQTPPVPSPRAAPPLGLPLAPSRREKPRWGLPARPQVLLTQPLIYLMLLSYAVIVIFPMLWLLYSSLKSDQDIFLYPFKLPHLRHLQWQNFSNAWF